MYDFNPEILQKERPIGVTGLMRVKNEAKFIQLSTESVIDALDELIIVYQKSSDNTEEIVNALAQKYPDKIRSFFYSPEIKSHNLTPEEFDKAKNLPLDSIHLLSNYYNFTLSKASYRFALKIDADQVYNTSKLKDICDGYRATKKSKINLLEYSIALILNFLSYLNIIMVSKTGLKKGLPLPSFLGNKYYNYALKKIQNDKIPSSISGINISIENGNCYIPLGSYAQNSYPPFNGINDHLIFKINSDTYYLPKYNFTPDNSKYGINIIEKFNLDNYVFKFHFFKINIVNLGFLWYHLDPIKSVTRHVKEKINFYPDNAYKREEKKFFLEALSSPLFNSTRSWMIFWWKNWTHQPKRYLICWNEMLKNLLLKVNEKNT